MDSLLHLPLILFLIGLLGIIINRKNIIVLLMSIELLLLAVNVLLLFGSTLMDDLHGQIFALYVLMVAASESAIGLSILVAFYRTAGTISIKFINTLKN